MHVVDTNILLYAAEPSFAEHATCRPLVERWRQGRALWHLTWNVIYEFLRITTHPQVFRTPWRPREAWGFIHALQASPGLRMLGETERHAGLLAEAVATLPGLVGNPLHDLHTAVLMREHGIRTIYTRDADFHRFPWVEVADPLSTP